MANTTSTKIFERINSLERELQQLKIEAYFSLPKRKQKSIYPEAVLKRAIQETRESIWQKRYAKIDINP